LEVLQTKLEEKNVSSKMIECLLTIVRRYRSTFRNLPINFLPMDNILRIISFLAPPPVPPLLDTYNFYDMLKPFYPPFLPNPNRFIRPKKVKKIDIATFNSLLSGWNLFDNHNPRSKDPDMIKLRQAIKSMIQSDRKNRLRALSWKPIMKKAIQTIKSIGFRESDICIIPREIATSIQGAEKFIRGPEYIEIYDKVDRVKRYMRTKGYKYYVVYNESQDRYHVIKIVEEYDGNGFTTTLLTSFDMMTQDEKKKVEDRVKYLMLERLRKRRTEELQSKLKQANAQYALQPPPKVGAGQDHDDQQDDMDQLLASLSPTSRGKLMDTIGRSRLQAQLRQLQKHKSAFVQAFTATARERLNTVQALQEIPIGIDDYSEELGVAIAFRANDYTYRLLIYNPLEEMWESPDWGILERWWTDTPQFKD
jgi:hypothetical protein